MTSWPSEAGAVLNMIDNFGAGIFATVMDSYDYTAALAEVLPGARSCAHILCTQLCTHPVHTPHAPTHVGCHYGGVA
jgi:hypothetical protein